MNNRIIVDVFKLRQQLRNWQRTLTRLENKIVIACDEISNLSEEDYNEVMELRTKVNIWNSICVQIEDQMDDTYERIIHRATKYKMRRL